MSTDDQLDDLSAWAQEMGGVIAFRVDHEHPENEMLEAVCMRLRGTSDTDDGVPDIVTVHVNSIDGKQLLTAWTPAPSFYKLVAAMNDAHDDEEER